MDKREPTDAIKMTSGARKLGGRGSASSSSSDSAGSADNALGSSLRQHQNYQDPQPGPFKCFLEALSRKKPLDCRTDTNLNRCLNLLDLTALGK